MAKSFKSKAKLGSLLSSTLAEQFADVFGVTGLNPTYPTGGSRKDMFASERQPIRRKSKQANKVIENLNTKAFTDKRTVGEGVVAVTKRKFIINKEV